MVKRILIKGGSPLHSSNGNTFLLIILFFLSWVIYLLCDTYKNGKVTDDPKQNINIINNMNKKVSDLYTPPLKNDNSYYYNGFVDGEMPINVRTRGHIAEYSQIGVLTKNESDKYPIFLPLMGRRVDRNKMQYYTASNTGNMNTKLPIKNKGRSCTDERGCDELFSDDEIFVEGYKTSIKATIYENTNNFAYMV
jgi:hypothetical protein